jgi:Tfp pilus assembly protein PilO
MILAATSWPDAAIAIAGILLVTTIVSMVVWQLFATGRTGISAGREQAYRRTAEASAEAQRETAEQLTKLTAEVTRLRQQTDELERMLKEVE